MKTILIVMLLFYVLLFLPLSGLAVTANLTWDAPAVDATHGAATGYKIYKGTDGACALTTPLSLFQTLSNVLTYADSTVTAGSTICYELTAINTGGESQRTARVTSTVPANPPAAPLNLRLNAVP